MPQYNTTIEDFSPVITYSSDWKAGSSQTDNLADLYSDSGFTLTQTDGGTATFVYNGTSFTIFGSKRSNHGFYQITVDGNAFPPDNGASPDPGQFQVPLFSSPPLPQALHTVTLTNQGSTFVDIDFVRLYLYSDHDSIIFAHQFMSCRSLGKAASGRMMSSLLSKRLRTRTLHSFTPLGIYGARIRRMWERFRAALASALHNDLFVY